jgi:hypothetical protein
VVPELASPANTPAPAPAPPQTEAAADRDAELEPAHAIAIEKDERAATPSVPAALQDERRAPARRKPAKKSRGEPSSAPPVASESPLRDFIPPSRREDG